MKEQEYERRLTERKEQIEAFLQSYLPQTAYPQKTLLEAMRYSVENGGKRLRPILMLESYLLFDGAEDKLPTLVAPFCAAIEMIHSYSLVHDDLPAMDNDQYRRGKLTTHAAFGEAMGILAGDGLLNFAFETALLAAGEPEDDARVLRALGVLARKAGAFGMIGGQTVDVELTGKALTAEQLEFIYRLKTGALLEASLMVGAILAGADSAQVEAVEQIAADVGMAFQIRDDILDEVGNEELLGKPVHSDEKNQKTTYAVLFGLEAARQEVRRLSERAKETLRGLGGESAFLEWLFDWLVSREY
ncbi:MAG: polyprenyl synthetase family protein [Lachnospiraceae bacterium]|nr:polyprenyl synthetase family protein [Lachnospiraceae bacterium]